MSIESIRQDFLDKLEGLKNLDLPEGQYLIWGSGPLAIRGIRERKDVDLLVTKAAWDQLALKHTVQGEKKNLITLGHVELWRECMNLTPLIDKMIEDCDLIEGHPFMKLKYMVQWKQHLGREKDLKDISLIEDLLTAQKSF